MNRSGWIAAFLGALLIVLFVAWLQDGGFGLADTAIPYEIDQPLRDLQVVWIAERAFLAGIDPSLPVAELAEATGVAVPTDSILKVHPRPPSGYLLEAWVGLLPSGWVATSGLVLATLGLAITIGLTGVLRGRSLPILFFPLLVLTDATWSLIWWRSTSWLTSVSILGCWVLARKRDSMWAGLALVPAAGTRLFPLILIPVLWLQDRRKAAVAAGAGLVLLNASVLALPHVSFDSTLKVLTSDKSDFLMSYGNGSLWSLVTRPGGHVAIAATLFVLAVVVVWLWSSKVSFDKAFGVAIAGGLLVVPVAWSHFRLVLLPLVAGPGGLAVWAAEFTGWLKFEWRWVTGFVATLVAGAIWFRRVTLPPMHRPDVDGDRSTLEQS